MLEIRPSCEHCNKNLPFDSDEAMICTFECTFCKNCVELLQHVCPNCGGGFENRPIRPSNMLEKYPVSKKVVHKPIDIELHIRTINKDQ
ncbi:DUF1272 domain-containing protein [Winogradskyella sp. A2]|uniref:DUF1272 domain-containing protein n=1 Tax=Winogradskyella sp. A2 TaxID=3366944 RepID=UPI00398C2CD2